MGSNEVQTKEAIGMVIRNGKVASKYQLEIQGEVIPSIEEDPIKCLGKWYDSSLNNRSMTEKQGEVWL